MRAFVILKNLMRGFSCYLIAMAIAFFSLYLHSKFSHNEQWFEYTKVVTDRETYNINDKIGIIPYSKFRRKGVVEYLYNPVCVSGENILNLGGATTSLNVNSGKSTDKRNKPLEYKFVGIDRNLKCYFYVKVKMITPYGDYKVEEKNSNWFYVKK